MLVRLRHRGDRRPRLLGKGSQFRARADLSDSPQGAGGVGRLPADRLPAPVTVAGGQISILIPSYDANGNIIACSDQTGRLVQRRDYDPFGNPVVTEKPRNASQRCRFFCMRDRASRLGDWRGDKWSRERSIKVFPNQASTRIR
jgi:hypothetical protein